MGLDTYLDLVIGVTVKDLAPNGLKREKFKKTRYDSETGAPFQVDDCRDYIVLIDGTRIDLDRYSGSNFQEHFKKFDLEVFGTCDNFYNGVVGVKACEGESCSQSQTMNVAAPNPEVIVDLITKIQGYFINAGFSQEIANKVKLHAVVDASY